MTAVATKTETRNLPNVSTHPPCKLDKATQGLVDDLNAAADTLVDRIDDWKADLDQLFLTGGAMTADDAIERRAELGREHASLSGAYVALVWRQFELREKLLPFYRQAAKAAADEAERVVQEILNNFADLGINANDVAAVNPTAAAVQLHFRARQKLPALASAAAASRAKNAAEILGSRVGVAPTPNSCRVTWTPPTATAPHILRLLGI